MSDEALAWPNPPTLTTGDDGVSYNLGVSFTITASQSCTGVQWRVPDSLTNAPVGGSYAMSIWDDNSGTRLAFQTIDPTGLAGTTHNFLFGSPVALSAGKYVAAIFTRPYVFRSDNPSGVTTPSGSATANEGRLVSFSSGSASTATWPNVNFVATYYISPLIALAGGSTVTPAGVAVPAAAGSPTVQMTVAPSGIAVPAATGSPTVRMVVSPAGIAVPVAAGTPTVTSDAPPPAPAKRGSWWQLLGILDQARVMRRQDATIGFSGHLSCPNDGEPLSVAANGVVYCRFDGWMPDGRYVDDYLQQTGMIRHTERGHGA